MLMHRIKKNMLDFVVKFGLVTFKNLFPFANCEMCLSTPVLCLFLQTLRIQSQYYLFCNTYGKEKFKKKNNPLFVFADSDMLAI